MADSLTDLSEYRASVSTPGTPALAVCLRIAAGILLAGGAITGLDGIDRAGTELAVSVATIISGLLILGMASGLSLMRKIEGHLRILAGKFE